MGGRIIPVLMCGGIGTRLWPLSRSGDPKQFQPLAGPDSLLVETLRRFDGPLFGDPVMLGNAAHLDLIEAELRSANRDTYQILIEPVVRSTAPAIAAAAVALAPQGEDTLMLVSPSDHVVGAPQLLRDAIALAAPSAAAGAIALFGITPDKPETGFGYIRAAAGSGPVLDVAGFIEKPNAARAVELLASGDCYWNSGMFLFSVGTILGELRRHAPELLVAAEAAVVNGRRESAVLWLDPASFAAAPTLSIDYAVMEKSDRCKVVPVAPNWSDVGSWEALWEIGDKDGDGNVVSGDAVVQQCHNVLAHANAGRVVAALGLDDIVIVDTADAVLVMARQKSQDVKSIVTALDAAGRPETRQHRTRRRSWGEMQVLAASDGTSTERLLLAAGANMTLDQGQRRVVVTLSGRGRLTAGPVSAELSAGHCEEIAGSSITLSADPATDLELMVVSWDRANT